MLVMWDPLLNEKMRYGQFKLVRIYLEIRNKD